MALPEDGRMDLADCITIGNTVAADISPAFKETAFMLNLVVARDFGESGVIKFPISGSLNSETVAEGAVYIPSDANSRMTDTAVTVTSTKQALVSYLSAESIKYGGGAASFARYGAEHGNAFGRAFDDAGLALFDSITQVATASGTMDDTTLLTGQYNVFNSTQMNRRTVAVISQKQLLDLKKLVSASGAAQYSNSSQITLIAGNPAVNSFAGNFLGTDIYVTTGLSATGGDTQGAIWDPLLGFCAGLGGAAITEIAFTGAGVASQIPGFSYAIASHIFFDVKVLRNTAVSELRSDT